MQSLKEMRAVWNADVMAGTEVTILHKGALGQKDPTWKSNKIEAVISL